MGSPLVQGVVQVHVTARCNLRCAHCYSSSSPQRRNELDLHSTLRALDMLLDEGYSQLSLSGGEPTLYRELPELLASARAMGWRTSMITNGLATRGRRTELLAQSLDVVAVSLDGGEIEHDHLRGEQGLFRKAMVGLGELRSLVPRVATATCVTPVNLPGIADLHATLSDIGVDVMQLRPIAAIGRGAAPLGDRTALTAEQSVRLAALAAYLDGAGRGPRVRCDHMRRDAVGPAVADMTAQLREGSAERFRSLVNPLVIDEHGDIYPFAYGLPHAYALANIADLRPGDLERCAAMGRLPELLCRSGDLADEVSCPPFVDWYALLVRAGEELQQAGVPLQLAGGPATPTGPGPSWRVPDR